MVTKVSKRLVIDASVARSAGGKDAIHPTSKHCRDFLQAVLNICHKIVMTADIKEEWNKHQSAFARRWRVSMVARKKLYCDNISINNELWNQIEGIAVSDKERGEMIKDLRLIEAALMTDKTVISLDDNTARKMFSKASVRVEELKDIVWVNPAKVEENPIEWLENGAAPESDRLLRNFCIK